MMNEKDEIGAGSATLTPSLRWALTGLSLSMLMPSLDTSIANVALPTLALALNVSFQEVQWVVIAYLLVITTVIVSVGRLGDMVGRKQLLLAGIALFAGASLVCGIAPTFSLLIAGRAAQGLGAAIMMALTVALAGESVPRGKTGSAMGLLGTMSAIGTTLGPSLGSLLMTNLGWRFIFLVNVPLGVVNFLLVYRYLRVGDREAAEGRRFAFDHAGMLLLGITLAAFTLAMTTGRGHFGHLNFGLLVTAVIGAGSFVFAERRAASPLIQLSMFRDRRLSAGLAMSILVTTVMMATLVVGPFYLSIGLGLETKYVGLALSVGPLVAAMAGVPAGRIVDRFGAQYMTIAGLVGLATGALIMSFVPPSFGVGGYVGPIAVITASYSMFQAANNTAVMTNIGANQRGMISGMLSLSRNFGLISGASAMGAIFAFASGTTDVTTAQAGAVQAGMRVTFAVALVLVAVAIPIAVVARNQPSPSIFSLVADEA